MSDHPTFAASIMRTVLTSPATLAKLAARGMFASVSLGMPQDIHSANIQILFDGEVTTKSIIEVYAPGDETGWAVAYVPSKDGKHTGETELIWGKWELVRDGHDFSRASSKAKREAGEVQLVDVADMNSRGEPTMPDLDRAGETPHPDADIEADIEGALGIDLEDEVVPVPQVPTDAETFGDLPREGFGDDALTETDEVAVTNVASGSWGRTMAEAEADDTPRGAKRPRSKRRPALRPKKKKNK